MFEVLPFLDSDDPWPKAEGLEVVRRIYTEKYLIASLLRPRSIVEIGVRAGYSAASFLSACPQATYLGLDSDKPIERFGSWPGSLARAGRMLRRCFGDRAEVRHSDTQELSELPCGPVDLIHVDGDHSYSGCLHDLRLAARRAMWILVDDIRHVPEVEKAANDFVRQGGCTWICLPTVRVDMLIRVDATK